MFIRYQKVRNAVGGTVAAVGAGIAAIFGFGGDEKPAQEPNRPVAVAKVDPRDNQRPVAAPIQTPPPITAHTSSLEEPVSAEQDPTPSAYEPSPQPRTIKNPAKPAKRLSKAELYASAMKIAAAPAPASGKGKDVLGSSSPWKLNLYDDNNDGAWERAKLDTNRDDVDDEKWNFKNGRWEKDGGDMVWVGDKWSNESLTVSNARSQTPVDAKLARYRSAMKLATSRADRSGKRKDVLGGRSPWKLNLYDDNKDGVWDRGKLDTNRDDIDDEKWNFKNDRWEKEGGDMVWQGDKWVPKTRSTVRPAVTVAPEQARYRRAMKIATSRADRSGKGKDVMGSSSPWKLNLYDDDKDGVWDRGKLDTNRDNVDDEKWNFKNGRWERDGGTTIWIDNGWQPAK